MDDRDKTWAQMAQEFKLKKIEKRKQEFEEAKRLRKLGNKS